MLYSVNLHFDNKTPPTFMRQLKMHRSPSLLLAYQSADDSFPLPEGIVGKRKMRMENWMSDPIRGDEGAWRVG